MPRLSLEALKQKNKDLRKFRAALTKARKSTLGTDMQPIQAAAETVGQRIYAARVQNIVHAISAGKQDIAWKRRDALLEKLNLNIHTLLQRIERIQQKGGQDTVDRNTSDRPHKSGDILF